MKLSDFTIDFIAKQGVNHIFEFIGGAITHLIDSTYGRSDIACVSVHHEQAGAFAAEAYARMNGKLGVAMATSGPGALNLITGIGSCYFDSIPCLFITGQVNTYEYKFDRPVRQIGFQETDIVSVAKPLTKYAAMVVDPEMIRYHLEKAVYLAQNGRPGPCLLDIPLNIQRAQVDPAKLPSFFDSEEYRQMSVQHPPDEESVRQIAELIRSAKRPVVLAGGGIRTGLAAEELQRLIELTNIPVVTSLMGLDVIPHDHPAFFGMIGAYGNRFSNLAVANADLLLILGSRLDSRQTGTRPDTFARAAKKVHVDIDPHELNAKVKADITIRSGLREFLVSLNARLQGAPKADLSPWYALLNDLRKRYPTASLAPETTGINPNQFLELLSGLCREGDVICLDVGQNQMWAAQSFSLKKDQRMLISGGMGAMGFSLPAALGAAKAAQGKRAIVISGDGGIQINIQDLDTIVKHDLPVKIFVLNNECLGMVRQFQDMYFGGRHQSTVIGYGCPNLVKIAEAYGIPSYSITVMEQAKTVIDRALEAQGPAFIEVRLGRDTMVNPKLLVNKPIEDMSPLLDREELKKVMLVEPAEEKDIPK